MPNAMRFLPLLLAVSLILPADAQAQWIDKTRTARTEAPTASSLESSSYQDGIAAIVNENVVTLSDVKARVALAELSANLPNTEEVQQRILPQVVRALVDEHLQMQEGKKIGVSVSPSEVQKALKKVSEDNQIPGGDISAFIKAHGISPTALEEQIKATLTWNKVVARELRSRIDIGDDEVESVVRRMRENAGKQEYLVSEIFLPVDQPKDEDEVKALSDKLLAEIKKGATFGAVARQFSKGIGASSGGDIGWVQVGQSAAEIDKVLQTLEPGELAGPIRATDGYHILGVRERRTIAQGDSAQTMVKLQQAFHPFVPGVEKDVLLKEADRLRQAISSCEGLDQKLAKDFPNWHWQDLGEVKLDSAAPWLAEKVRNVPVGHSSEALATDKGAMVLFVCDRQAPENIDRQAIRNQIGNERMEVLARRLMRDLRRAATIELKL